MPKSAIRDPKFLCLFVLFRVLGGLSVLALRVRSWRKPLSVFLCVLFGSISSARGEGAAPAVTSMAFSPDGKLFAVGTFGQVTLYDAATWEPKEQFREIAAEARSLAFSPDSKMLAIGGGLPGRSGVVTLWDLDANKGRKLPVRAADTIEAIAYRKDGKELLACANDNKVSLFENLPATGSAILDEHNGRVLAASFSPKDGYLYVTGGMDKLVKVWNAKTQKTIVNFDQSEAGVTGLGFINNDQFVGSSLDGKIRWWGVNYDAKKDAYNGYHFRTQDANKGGVNALAVSADGKRIVTGGEDSGVSVWEDNGNRRCDFHDTLGPIYAVAISPDGKKIAAGGRDGKINIWDVEAKKLIQTFPAPLPPAPKPPVVASKSSAKSKSKAHKKRSGR